MNRYEENIGHKEWLTKFHFIYAWKSLDMLVIRCAMMMSTYRYRLISETLIGHKSFCVDSGKVEYSHGKFKKRRFNLTREWYLCHKSKTVNRVEYYFEISFNDVLARSHLPFSCSLRAGWVGNCSCLRCCVPVYQLQQEVNMSSFFKFNSIQHWWLLLH